MIKFKTSIIVNATAEAIEKAYTYMKAIGVKVDDDYRLDKRYGCAILTAKMNKVEQNKARAMGYVLN